MKVFVTGVNGQLGHDVMKELNKRGIEAIGSGSGATYKGDDTVALMPYVQLDITDFSAVKTAFAEIKPDAVIHCAAWTAVDAAEEPENYEKVKALNVSGPENIAKACKILGAGREKKSDTIDYSVGVYLNKKYGEKVLEGETLAIILSNKNEVIKDSEELIKKAYSYSDNTPEERNLIYKIIN